MKLLAVSTSCINPVNRELYRRLNQSGVEVLLVVPDRWNLGKGTIETPKGLSQDPQMLFLPPTSYHHRLYKLIGVEKLIATEKPDVIYLEGDPASRMSRVMGLAAKQTNARFWAISCENLPQDPLSVMKREGLKAVPSAIVKYWLLLQSRKVTDRLFVINDEGKRLFDNYGFKQVSKTPLGFNENIFKIDLEARRRIRRALKIEDDEHVIAYFGRMVFEKGVHVLIEALAQLKANPAWRLMVDDFDIYQSPYLKEVKMLIEKHQLEKRVIYIHANHTEIADYMNASDIVVLPSVSTKKWVEQYGRVVPEAMSCGKTVLASSSGAPKEMVFNKEWVFRENDAAGLRNLLVEAMKTPHQKSTAEEIHTYTTENFGLNRQVALFIDSLEK
ncbi:MAG: glycosyltransferase family 4 protein [Imperialibacter sp.]|uniref:glycosyltransferase family 4 protein n=1 Tax=Imperialibacter sp. TaxID=2038411 RepID=UPI0032EC014F